MAAKTSEELWEEVVEMIPSIAKWTTVAFPILIDMQQRLKENPEEPSFYQIVYPGTSIPIFTEDQALQLEDLVREIGIVDKELEEEEEKLPRQVGGSIHILPPDVRDTIEKVVSTSVIVRDTIGKFALSSPDNWWEIFKDFLLNQLPELAKNIKEAGEIGGLTKYETVLSDVNGVITVPVPFPPFVIPIPYKIPSKTIIPLISAGLDIIRFTISTVPFVGTLSSLPFTLLLALLELGKGKLYDFFATLFGLIGTNGIVLGILTKLALGTTILLGPAIKQIPPEMLDAGYKAGKATITSFLLQFFATVSPDIIRLPLSAFTETMKQAARVFNNQVKGAMETVASTTNDRVHLEMALVDIDMIPSFMDILSIQRLLQNPAFLAYPGVMDLLTELRKLFPFNIITDLLNIPHKESSEFQQMVAENPPGSIAEKFTPKLKVKNPKTGEYTDIQDIKETSFGNIAQQALPEMPILPTLPSVPTLPTMPTIPTLPSVPTLPILPTIPRMPTLPKKGGGRLTRRLITPLTHTTRKNLRNR
jgi:hypothetical protein